MPGSPEKTIANSVYYVVKIVFLSWANALSIMTIKDFFSFRQEPVLLGEHPCDGRCGSGIAVRSAEKDWIYIPHGEAVIVPDVKGMGVESEKCSVTAAWSASFRIPVMSRLFLPAASSNIIRQPDKR